MRSTFKTVFHVNGSKEKNGIAPIMGRAAISEPITQQFSCKQRISKELNYGMPIESVSKILGHTDIPHTNLRESDKQETRKRHIHLREQDKQTFHHIVDSL